MYMENSKNTKPTQNQLIFNNFIFIQNSWFQDAGGRRGVVSFFLWRAQGYFLSDLILSPVED